MELISDDSRLYLLHQRLARRWIRDGGVVIAKGTARAGSRSTFDLAQTVASGATLQVTLNIREVSKACQLLSEYAIYFWTCDQEGEYILGGFAESDGHALENPTVAVSRSRPYRTITPSCYAGRHPNLRLEVHSAEVSAPNAASAVIMMRMSLPKGLCAAIYQPTFSRRPTN